MKKRLFLLVMIASIFFSTGCFTSQNPEKTPQEIAAEQEALKQHRQDLTNRVIREIIYIKDPRTGICFAYGWMGYGHGGPMFTTIPESYVASIPKGLLYTAEFGK